MGMNQKGDILVGAIVALVIFGVVTALYVGIDARGYKRGKEEIQDKWDKANQEQREREAHQAETASTKLENDNAKARVVTRTITHQVEKVVEKPVYRNVCLDDTGLCLARAAIRGEGSTACQPDKSVSIVARADGRDGGIRFALDRGVVLDVFGVREEASGTR